MQYESFTTEKILLVFKKIMKMKEKRYDGQESKVMKNLTSSSHYLEALPITTDKSYLEPK